MSFSAMLWMTVAFTLFGALVAFGANAFLDIEASFAKALSARRGGVRR